MPTGYYLLDHANRHGRHYYPTRNRPLLVYVMHITAGLQDLDGVDDQSAEAVCRYCSTTDRQVSWHVATDTDSVVRVLPPSYTAWHAANYNSVGYGHEISKLHVRWREMPAAWVEATLRQAARAAAPVVAEYGIPLRRVTRGELDRAIATGATKPVGFIEHSVLDPTRRSDPGADFPWDRFFELVQHYLDNRGDDMSEQAEKQIGYINDALGTAYDPPTADRPAHTIGDKVRSTNDALGHAYDPATGRTIGHRVKDIETRVEGIDEKVNRLLQQGTEIHQFVTELENGIVGEVAPIDYDQLARAILRNAAPTT
ncbi:MAG TPA: N-acetylmuramoyl-L-alanine amidase [Pseudonocardiaceae bacterium]